MSPKATILIVDDEPDLREVLEEYFVSQGYIALSAESARGGKGTCRPAMPSTWRCST